MPDMAAAAIPVLPRTVVTRVAGHYTSFDAGRGCPFQCCFCTIINVQGRKSRYRTADDVEAVVRANAAQGVTRFFVTDDNFARNRNWEPILDRLIELRENQGFKIRLLLQVDTLCHKIPGFIEKAARAGCNAVFIGLENINPAVAHGGQEAPEQDLGISRHAAGVAARQGDDLGRLHPRLSDRHARIDRPRHRHHQARTADRHPRILLPTPLPGSEDHKVLHLKGARMEEDMNNYDLEHVCADHAIMSADAWRGVYRDAWARYYSDAHVETVLRRAVASGINPRKIVDAMTVFSGSSRIEGVHPLQFGYVRRKIRTQRRHGLQGRQSARVLSLAGVGLPVSRGKMGRAGAALSFDPAPRARRSERRGLHGRGAEALDRGRP